MAKAALRPRLPAQQAPDAWPAFELTKDSGGPALRWPPEISQRENSHQVAAAAVALRLLRRFSSLILAGLDYENEDDDEDDYSTIVNRVHCV